MKNRSSNDSHNDRRQHNRTEINYQARLSKDDNHAQPALIKDFSESGMLISYKDALDILTQHEMTIGNEVDVSFDVKTHQGIKNYQLKATIARALDNGIGLKLVEPDPEMLRVLNAISMKRQEQLSENDLKQNIPFSIAHLVNLFEEETLKFLNPLLNQFFKNVENYFFEIAQSAKTNTEQSQYMESRDIIGKKKSTLEKSFNNKIVQQIALFQSNKLSDMKGNTQKMSALSLVEKETFDDWLVIRVISSKADNHFQNELFGLQKRLSFICQQKIHNKNNPVGPTLLCEAFQMTFKNLNIDRASERSMYEVFEKSIVSHLGIFYQNLNRILAKKGVLTHLRPEIKKQPASDSESNQDVSSDLSSDQTETDIEEKALGEETPQKTYQRRNISKVFKNLKRNVSHNDTFADDYANNNFTQTPALSAKNSAPPAVEAYKNLSQFFSKRNREKQSKSSDGYVSNEAITPALANDQFLKNLNQIQFSNTNLSSTHLSLKQQIEHYLEENSDNANINLSEEQSYFVDLTDGIVRNIHKSQRISDAIFPHLKRLEAPIAKLMMSDSHFLQSKNHPARKLLDRIARLGASGTVITTRVKKSIEETIENVVNHFNDDISVFENSLETLDSLVNKQNEVYKKNVERLRQVYEGQQKTENAKKYVLEEIDKRIAGKSVPKLAIDTLKAGWENLLVLTRIREGDSSKNWTMYMQIFERLLELHKKNAKKIKVNFFIDALKGGLTTANSGQFKHQNLVGLIQGILKVQESGDFTVRIEMVDIPASTPETQTVKPEQSRERVKSDEGKVYLIGEPSEKIIRWVERVKRLQVGDWIEITSENKSLERVRLAWIGEDYSKLVFINHQGMKVFDLSLQELATMMQNGRAIQVYDTDESIVNVALDEMVRNIYENLSHEATHDELTGLINHNEFIRRIDRSIMLSQGERLNHVVAFVTIHRFKLINQSFGYEQSNEILKTFANRLKQTMESEFSVHCARQANADFTLLLERTTSETAYRKFSEFIDHLTKEPIHIESNTVSLNIHIGLYELKKHSIVAGDAVKFAEQACDNAQDIGQDNIQVYKPSERDTDTNNQWVASVQSTIDYNRLNLRSQGVKSLNTASENWIHSEILMVVFDENGKEQPPKYFIKAAEEFEKMAIVDRWVISTTLRWAQHHPTAFAKLGGVSINLSGHSINDESFAEFLFEILHETQVPLEKICFEITETTMIANIDDASDFINELKDYGCLFSLDDFGSGLSSYNYLKNLNVDFIKIDKSFIQQLHENSNNLAMVKSIKEMGHYMGKQVIAEGVEDKETLDLLIEIGVDFAQGYYIQRPSTLELAKV
ncbi:MAG: DUF1631 family protein [Pseudomonadota bacterium]